MLCVVQASIKKYVLLSEGGGYTQLTKHGNICPHFCVLPVVNWCFIIKNTRLML